MSCVSCARTSSSTRPRVTTPEHILPESVNISLTQNHMFLVLVCVGGGGGGCVHNILLHFTACLYFLSPSRPCIVNIGSTVYQTALGKIKKTRGQGIYCIKNNRNSKLVPVSYLFLQNQQLFWNSSHLQNSWKSSET